jgi:hypothetical protein
MLARFVPAVAVLLALGACGQVPQPFQSSANGRAEALVDIGPAAGIQVDMVDGPPAPMARLLAQSVADSLGTYNIPATTTTSRASRYVLKGRADINDIDPKVPYVVVINWTLLDRGGRTIGRYTQGVPGSRWQWDFGDPRIIWAVGKDAAKPIAAMVQDGPVVAVSHQPETAASSAAPARADGVWIEPVSGAPGDGNTALGRAIKATLQVHQVPLARNRAEAAFVLLGTVAMSPPAGGRQEIKIVWRVADRDGNELGRATQENAVPAGSLDGPWGRIAPIVAEAAVGGIQDVVARGRAATLATSTNGQPRLAMPPRFELPRIKGRAPPPPT